MPPARTTKGRAGSFVYDAAGEPSPVQPRPEDDDFIYFGSEADFVDVTGEHHARERDGPVRQVPVTGYTLALSWSPE